MKRNIPFSGFIIVVFLLSLQIHGQVVYLKQNDVINGSIGSNREEVQPQNLRYKDSTLLKEGRYLLEQEEKDIKMSFYINTKGRIDGELLTFGLKPPGELITIYKNDTLIKYEAKYSGTIIRSEYLEKGIFYRKKYTREGKLKSEERFRDGKTFYSKRMDWNGLYGWVIKDSENGIDETYYKETNVVKRRTTTKGLKQGMELMKEEFDENGKLQTKVIKYKDGKEKTINQDGSYQIFIRSINNNDYIYKYDNKGKLLDKEKQIYISY